MLYFAASIFERPELAGSVAGLHSLPSMLQILLLPL